MKFVKEFIGVFSFRELKSLFPYEEQSCIMVWLLSS